MQADQAKAIRHAAFELARKLPRDPSLRERFVSSGWRSGDHIIVALADEPIADVMERMLIHDTGGKAHLVIPDEGEAHGLRIFAVRTA
jgi:hypothetical protein